MCGCPVSIRLGHTRVYVCRAVSHNAEVIFNCMDLHVCAGAVAGFYRGGVKK
jgi:hypothetical protein